MDVENPLLLYEAVTTGARSKPKLDPVMTMLVPPAVENGDPEKDEIAGGGSATLSAEPPAQ
jgi:hypothetical protein